jgi:hypothetical protein
MSIWTNEMDEILISTVKSQSNVSTGIQKAADALEMCGVTSSSARNRWYSPTIKKKLGIPLGEDQRKVKTIEDKKDSTILIVGDSKNILKQAIVESMRERVEPIEVPHPILTSTEPMHEPMRINNDVSQEARLAISDFKDTMELMIDSLNRLVKSNSDLLRDNENTKSEHNRLLRDYNEMSESYTHMLKMMNQARALALKEEDRRNGYVPSSVSMTMDTNGNLNTAG